MLMILIKDVKKHSVWQPIALYFLFNCTYILPTNNDAHNTSILALPDSVGHPGVLSRLMVVQGRSWRAATATRHHAQLTARRAVGVTMCGGAGEVA